MTLNLVPITEVLLDSGKPPIDCDLDVRGKLCSLVRISPKQLAVILDTERIILPESWANFATQVRWVGEEAIVWPIARPSDGAPYIGVVSASGVRTIKSEFPLSVFSDGSIVAIVYSEEFTRVDVPPDQQSDIISIFDMRTESRIARFVEAFSEKFSHELFLEVTCCVVDSDTNSAWFTAYNTEFIWHYSFRDHTYLSAVPLECNAEEVIALTCSGLEAIVICSQNGQLKADKYVQEDGRIVFKSSNEIVADEHLRAFRAGSSNRICGFPNGYLTTIGSSRALLAHLVALSEEPGL